MCSVDKPRPIPLSLHSIQNDEKESEKIVDKIRINIYPRKERQNALLFHL